MAGWPTSCEPHIYFHMYRDPSGGVWFRTSPQNQRAIVSDVQIQPAVDLLKSRQRNAQPSGSLGPVTMMLTTPTLVAPHRGSRGVGWKCPLGTRSDSSSRLERLQPLARRHSNLVTVPTPSSSKQTATTESHSPALGSAATASADWTGSSNGTIRTVGTVGTPIGLIPTNNSQHLRQCLLYSLAGHYGGSHGHVRWKSSKPASLVVLYGVGHHKQYFMYLDSQSLVNFPRLSPCLWRRVRVPPGAAFPFALFRRVALLRYHVLRVRVLLRVQRLRTQSLGLLYQHARIIPRVSVVAWHRYQHLAVPGISDDMQGIEPQLQGVMTT